MNFILIFGFGIFAEPLDFFFLDQMNEIRDESLEHTNHFIIDYAVPTSQMKARTYEDTSAIVLLIVLLVASNASSFVFHHQAQVKSFTAKTSQRRLRRLPPLFGESKKHQPIPPEQIASLKKSINIVDVVQDSNLAQFQRISIDKATAICPFHDDKNPSLSIDQSRNMYKCFSCGAGGDVFKFVRDLASIRGGEEEMGFLQSVQYVANKYGLPGGMQFDFAPASFEKSEERKEREAKKQR